ncbi:MAG: hypothetical protein ACI9WU_002004 [Myxococcota bacterium]|jgi:hypothetical protein
MKRAIATLTLTALIAACATPAVDEVLVDGGQSITSAWDEDYGKPVLGVPARSDSDSQKFDSAKGIKGPLGQTNPEYAVWELRNQWHDTDSADARAAGMAWGENSGLTWDEKYAAWIDSMEKLQINQWRSTFWMTTPEGKKLQAPELECAETSLFLRITFASWYGLPFYISAADGSTMMHFGHFGVYLNNGPDPRFSRYATRYTDHSGLSAEDALANWPTDTKLAGRKLTPRGDDLNEWMGDNAYAGQYFDQTFLNKRVGHFLMVALTFTGSMHLASHWNTFNVKAPAIRPGDTLLQRWQRQGIGHTLVVKHVAPVEGFDDKLNAEAISGSMPRRQPVWATAAGSKSYFTAKKSGGAGDSFNDGPYAGLGGGLKRWRTATIVDGRWRNIVAPSETANWINHNDQEAIAERVQIFETLLGAPTPESQLEAAIAVIQAKRDHLRSSPASCSARIGREEAFAKLYEVTSEHFNMTREDADLQYRMLEDYVFAELTYEQSRTCCWNSTTPEMFDVVMDLAQTTLYDDETETCNEPPVFMMENAGYERFAAHADAMGIGDRWVEWSADESCPQAVTVETDTIAEAAITPYCTIRPFEAGVE